MPSPRPLSVVIRVLAVGAVSAAGFAELPPVPAPPENPITESVRVLGKVLFWDAQLSSDNTVACGTCHQSRFGGTDSRHAAHPGHDGIWGNDDDLIGSPGMRRAQADGTIVPDEFLGFRRRTTERATISSINSGFLHELFWDGRAGETFVDPETGRTVIETGGALETLSLIPILSDVEMGWEERTWDDVRAKLSASHPLALATDLPPDVAAAIEPGDRYGDLFARTFGDDAITAQRIAFALATYQRTLVADQTPWDRFMAGETDAMTDLQRQGWETFTHPTAQCRHCHVPPLFTSGEFKNIGVASEQADIGRMEVTGDPADLGRFKIPSLRNVGLQETHMHTGRVLTVLDVVLFYRDPDASQHGNTNVDPLIEQIMLPPGSTGALVEFLSTALVDPRVENATFPFDRPKLHSELPANPALVAPGTAGLGDIPPVMNVTDPPNLGNATFRFAVHDARGGATATLELFRNDPSEAAAPTPVETLGPIVLADGGAGDGYGTVAWPIPRDAARLGDTVYARWRIVDDAAADGHAYSDVAALRFYDVDPTTCTCAGDLDCDGAISISDLQRLLERWGPTTFDGADLDDNGRVDFADLLSVMTSWGACRE